MTDILQRTSDGSHTLFSFEAGETYHSHDGAIMEAEHVYLRQAFETFADKGCLNILETGFGAGLNALLTMLESHKRNITVYYETLEPHPVSEEIYQSLNYCEMMKCDRQLFLNLHVAAFDQPLEMPPFTFIKRMVGIENFSTTRQFDVIYFDAFSPVAQPEIWTENIFRKLRQFLSDNGILLTYSSKGSVKKALRAAGFNVRRLSGAGSKHHMLKAIR
ncbi:MAG: tRNA (5-methylaminomethyl-2-thiouridine)(34)-methyltransferase MnmD [Prevotellaceae bacterium]|jgi:tRNA U34 5-methylaminomethyl-2-thiouridine-forming methyltransferase MnmC|nr:tRNA (5-methylaminomethyl-2-thiouridine)(34)-methyltransferase MnmD [Prevotellaceae bacterium]